MMNVMFAFLGIVCAAVITIILNKMPAKCFCDYDETPNERHNAQKAGKWAFILFAFVLSAVFPILVNQLGIYVKSVFLCLFCAVLLMIALSDIRFCIIPDELIIAGCILATIAVFPGILSGQSWAERLSPVLGAVIGAVIILAINCLGRILYKKDALGMGDLKLMAICGIACGTSGTIIAMLVGIFAAGIWFAFGIALKRIRNESYMPLGPFLIFGTLFTLCFRPMVDSVLAWYISLI